MYVYEAIKQRPQITVKSVGWLSEGKQTPKLKGFRSYSVLIPGFRIRIRKICSKVY